MLLTREAVLRQSERTPCCCAGDLGTIDTKYDIAVSSACGALDYIVVDTADTAKQCVKYIRDKGLGVATFLILAQQEGLSKAADGRIDTPEGAARHSQSCSPHNNTRGCNVRIYTIVS